jgi:hypothetical protein
MISSIRRSLALASLTLIVPSPGAAQPAPAGGSTDSMPPSEAQPSREQCLSAHKSAQELKQGGNFLEAQEHLVVCSSATCPGVVISDCGTWIADLEKITPSMIFEIRADGKEAPEAKIFVDQNPVLDLSHAVKVNPGRHTIRVELPPYPPHEETLTLPEGQRMRLVSVAFHSKDPEPVAVPAAPPPVREPERPTPFVVYPLFGLGVVGLASFGVFSLLGQQEQKELEETCAPDCTDADLESMKKMYLIGDISAGIGAAALLTSAVVYLTRPTESAGGAAAFALGVGPVPHASADSVGIRATGSF